MSEEKYAQYFELLRQWNKKLNLTSIDDEDGFRSKHLGDSLQVVPFLNDAKKILDLGSGAGLPGILIKIARPNIEVTLLDATRKKVSFCNEVVRKLSLSGIRAVWGRAEDAALQQSLGKFDLVVSRATWKLHEFLRIAKPYINPDGRCLAMKGSDWAAELEAVGNDEISHFYAMEGTHPYELLSGESRCIVVFKLQDSHSPT